MTGCDRDSKLATPLAAECGNSTAINCIPSTDGKPTWTPQPDQFGIARDIDGETLWLYDCDLNDWIAINNSFSLCDLNPANIDNLANVCNILNIPVTFDAGGICVEGLITLQDLADKIDDCLPDICDSPHAGTLVEGDDVLICGPTGTQLKEYIEPDPCDAIDTGDLEGGDHVLICGPTGLEKKEYIDPCDSPDGGDVDDGEVLLTCGPGGIEKKIYNEPCNAPDGGDVDDGEVLLVCGPGGVEKKVYNEPDPCDAVDTGDLVEGNHVLVCGAGGLEKKEYLEPEPFDPCNKPDGGVLLTGDGIVTCRNGDVVLTDIPVPDEPCSTRVRHEDNDPLIEVYEEDSCGDCCGFVVKSKCAPTDPDLIRFVEDPDEIWTSDEYVWVCDVDGNPVRKRIRLPDICPCCDTTRIEDVSAGGGVCIGFTDITDSGVYQSRDNTVIMGNMLPGTPLGVGPLTGVFDNPWPDCPAILEVDINAVALFQTPSLNLGDQGVIFVFSDTLAETVPDTRADIRFGDTRTRAVLLANGHDGSFWPYDSEDDGDSISANIKFVVPAGGTQTVYGQWWYMINNYTGPSTTQSAMHCDMRMRAVWHKGGSLA